MRLLYVITALMLVMACSSMPNKSETQVNQSVASEHEVCDLPYTRYQATVTGYCQEQAADLAEVPTKEFALEIRPVNEIPEVFWYNRKMRYTLNKQSSSAPLVFVIAGTGASHNGQNMVALQRMLYQQGYHVISLSSPTFANYIINATTRDDMIGDLSKDAKSLYKTMQKVYQQVQAEEAIEVTGFSLTGYSLGGAHSAFVSYLDEQEQVFNFEKVVLINPPVSLYNSVQVLDSYLDLAHNRADIANTVESIFDRFAQQYSVQESSEFTQESIFSMFAGAHMSEADLKLLIGASFRMSSTDMMFAIDTTYNLGAFNYKNHEISKFESITHSMHRADNINFTTYFEGYMVPWTQKFEPGTTRESMIERLSLSSLEGYLSTADKISVVTNADDIILIDGEVDYLKKVFGKRAKIFERGGHCGNMDRKSFVEYMNSQFQGASL